MQPWLHLAESARARADLQGLAEAIFRASQATTDKTYANLMMSQLLSSAGDELPDAELRLGVGIGAGVSAAWTLTGLQAASDYCSAATVVDSNRRQVCEVLVHTMVAQSESLGGILVAARVGGRIGWNAERVDFIRSQANAMAGVLMSAQMGVPEMDSIRREGCAMYTKTAARLARVFQIGELGAAREAVLRSGRTVQEVTQA